MAIEIYRSHHLDKATSRRMVEDIAASIGEQFSFSYAWEGDRLTFRHLGISGYIAIADQVVHVYVKKSRFLPISEDCIRQEIETVMNAYIG